MTDQVVATIERVGVVGCGTMGAGIAEIVARNGIPVRFIEIDDGAVEAGLKRIHNSLDRQVRRERISDDDRDAIAQRITGGTAWSDLGVCDLIGEAVPEMLELK